MIFMLKKSQKGIWETDVRTINLSHPKVLKWYLERKIQVGDWKALNRVMLARMLGNLVVDAHIKELLHDFLYVNEHSHRTSSTPARRARKK